MSGIPAGKYCPPRGKSRCPHRGWMGHVPMCMKFDWVLTQGKTKESQIKVPPCRAGQAANGGDA